MTKRNGRPPYAPSEKERDQVKMLAAMGIPHANIAKVVGIAAPTLRKHFADELEVGHIQANAQVAQSLFRSATAKEKPSVIAAIFWLKCQAGWREDAGRTQDDESGDQPGPAMGKKEQAAADARTAADGTDWSDLLPKPGTPLQ